MILYVSVKRLAELDSEGITLGELSKQYPDAIKGDTGDKGPNLQFLLGMVANFNEEVPPINVDGVFGKETKRAVIAFQSLTACRLMESWEIEPGVGIWRAYQGVLQAFCRQTTWVRAPPLIPARRCAKGAAGRQSWSSRPTCPSCRELFRPFRRFLSRECSARKRRPHLPVDDGPASGRYCRR